MDTPLQGAVTLVTRETRACHFSWNGKWIRITYVGEQAIEPVDAWEHVAILQELSGRQPRLVLADLSSPRIKPATPEARAIYSGPHSLEYVSRMAMIIRSPAGRLIGNLFLKVNAPPYPVKLFTAEPQALAWLLERPADRVLR